MTDAIKKVIKKLQDATGIAGKYTVRVDEESEKWLQKLIIKGDTIRLFPNFYAVFADFNDSNYLILVDHDNSDREFRIPEYLEEVDINSGAWVAIIKELDLPLRKNVDENLKELLGNDWEEDNFPRKRIIFNQKMGSPEFSLADLFCEISLYKITSKFTQANSLYQLYQLTGCILVKGASYRLLPYSDDVIKKFEDIFENGNKYIPFDNILVSYVASDFKFAYLDLYRCIEKLESLYFLSDLYRKLSLQNTSLLDFCKNIDEFIGLHRLRSHKSLLENLFLSTGKTPKESEKEAEKLYKTRNIIAHLSPNQANELPQDASGWNEYIYDILCLIKTLYNTNQNLFEI